MKANEFYWSICIFLSPFPVLTLTKFLQFLMLITPSQPFFTSSISVKSKFMGYFSPCLDKMCKKANAGKLVDLVKLLIRCNNSLVIQKYLTPIFLSAIPFKSPF